MAEGGNWGIDKGQVIEYNESVNYKLIATLSRHGGRKHRSLYVTAEGNLALARGFAFGFMFSSMTD